MTSPARRTLSFTFLAVAVAIAISTPARVAACSCMEQTLAEAVRGADVAFVGTLAGTNPPIPAPMQPGMEEIVWTWDVERSRDAIETAQVQLAAWPDDGANCGVAFGPGERWLVIAHESEGRLSSSSCAMNQIMNGTQPEVEAQIAGMVTVIPAAEPGESAAPDAGPNVPVWFVVGTVVLLAAFSAWAFLGRRPT